MSTAPAESKKEPPKMEFGFGKKKSFGTSGCSHCGQQHGQYNPYVNTPNTQYKGGCGGCGKTIR